MGAMPPRCRSPVPPLFSRVDGRDPVFEDTPDVVSREAGREVARLLPADDPPWISRDCGRDPAGCHSRDCGRIHVCATKFLRLAQRQQQG